MSMRSIHSEFQDSLGYSRKPDKEINTIGYFYTRMILKHESAVFAN